MIRGGALQEVALGRTLISLKQNAMSGRAFRGINASQPKVNSALSEETVLLHVETNIDGTVTYHFGLEGEHVATITPSAALELPLVEPALGHTNGHHNGSNGAVSATPSHQTMANFTNGNGSPSHLPIEKAHDTTEPSAATAPPHLPALSTAEAAEKLEELLHLETPAREHIVPSTSQPTPIRAGKQTNNVRIQPQQQQHKQPHKEHRTPPPNVNEVDLDALDYESESAYNVIGVYSALCDADRLDDALALINGVIKAKRNDVLMKLKHYKFLRPASRLRSVSKALRFVQLLPRQYTDARTYNMLLTVCAEAGDLRNALHAVDMLKAVGLKMDTILYTTLIKVCAAAQDAEHAFKVYDEMIATGTKLDKQIYATLVSACSRHIERLPASDRRSQLVLLERAFAAVEDMKDRKMSPDAAVWNALVTASGRAGQLQRAFDVLENMMTNTSKPNARTYASLIDACARTGDKALAMRVYKRALKDGCLYELLVYAAAINACIRSKEGSDIEGAMAVYSDLQRNGVQADSALYGALIMAAGKAGNLDLTLSLEDEMRADGLAACEGTDSALLTVQILNDRLPEATAMYKKLRKEGRWPHHHAMNALINANARCFRLGDVVNLVCDMVEGKMAVDGFTFAAILNACQRADESELALDVYRLMKLRGVRVEEVHCMLLLRMCYNRIRQSLGDAGNPLSSASAVSSSSHRQQERAKLLKALTPTTRKSKGKSLSIKEVPTVGDVVWHAQAFGIYRDAVSNGFKPSLRVLNMVLMCLRVPWITEKRKLAAAEANASSSSLPPGATVTGLRPAVSAGPTDQKIGIEGVYHIQVISILEDAIVSGVLPSFQVDSPSPIDLRSLPPAVAEVYALTVVAALQRKVDARREVINRCVFLVPRYDGGKVLMPSTVTAVIEEEQEHQYQQQNLQLRVGRPPENANDSSNSHSIEDVHSFADEDAAYALAADSPAGVGEEKTGLGVAGVLRRLQLWAREYSPEGLIVLESKEITRWAKTTSREIEKRSVSALSINAMKKSNLPPSMGLNGNPGGANGIFQQQRNFRIGF